MHGIRSEQSLIYQSLLCLTLLILTHCFFAGVHSPSSHLAELRLVKSPSELALMRKAGRLAADAFKQTMRSTKPGVNERELESVFEQSVKSQGAQWMAFPPVVAGGERAICLHYISNNRTLQCVCLYVVYLYVHSHVCTSILSVRVSLC